jgi:hypothetical protein
VHTGLISDAFGAAGLPDICGGRATAWAVLPMETPTASAATTAAIPRIAPRLARSSIAVIPARPIVSDRLNGG